MKYSKKLTQILAFSGWTRSRLAQLMGVSNFAIIRWTKGRRIPRGEHAAMIDYLYAELVEPYICYLEIKADDLAEKFLKKQIAKLPDDNFCKK